MSGDTPSDSTSRDSATSPGIGIVAQTPGSSDSDTGHIATPMIINILLQFHDDIHLFTRATAQMEFDQPNIHTHKYTKPFAESEWYLRLPGQVIYQLKYSVGILRVRNDIGLILFRGSGFIIPLLVSKSLGLCVLSRVAGVIWRQEGADSGSAPQSLWSKLLKHVQLTMHRFTDVLVLISTHSTEFADVQQFAHKSRVWCHYYFDLEQFSIKRRFAQRDQILGQVAKISETKGSLQLVESMVWVHREFDAKLLMVGDGPLYEAARRRCEELNVDAEFTGRIDRSDVPDQLNRMKLHVMCSVSEGLPKAAIEAMACGTPVLATEVGGLPDIIDHGHNGFLMSSNEPERLEEAIVGALKNHDLEAVSRKGRRYVEENYSYQSAIEGYYALITQETPYDLPEPPTEPEQPIHIP